MVQSARAVCYRHGLTFCDKCRVNYFYELVADDWMSNLPRCISFSDIFDFWKSVGETCAQQTPTFDAMVCLPSDTGTHGTQVDVIEEDHFISQFGPEQRFPAWRPQPMSNDRSLWYQGTAISCENRRLQHEDRSFRVGVRPVLARPFLASNPGLTPLHEFNTGRRLIHIADPSMFLIYVGAAAPLTAVAMPQGLHSSAGWAFVYRYFDTDPKGGVVSGCLERKGPHGLPTKQIRSDALLRAFLGALRYRDWAKDGCATLVVATDSPDLVQGTTTRARRTINIWWPYLLGEIERSRQRGMAIAIWHISSDLNKVANEAALKEVCTSIPADAYQDMIGRLI